MTNEERARAIRRTWGLNIVFAASASKNDLGEACDGLEAAILSALDAATVPLVAERERLRGALKMMLHTHPPISKRIGGEGSPARCWQEDQEAAIAQARSALAEKEPG